MARPLDYDCVGQVSEYIDQVTDYYAHRERTGESPIGSTKYALPLALAHCEISHKSEHPQGFQVSMLSDAVNCSMGLMIQENILNFVECAKMLIDFGVFNADVANERGVEWACMYATLKEPDSGNEASYYLWAKSPADRYYCVLLEPYLLLAFDENGAYTNTHWHYSAREITEWEYTTGTLESDVFLNGDILDVGYCGSTKHSTVYYVVDGLYILDDFTVCYNLFHFKCDDIRNYNLKSSVE